MGEICGSYGRSLSWLCVGVGYHASKVGRKRYSTICILRMTERILREIRKSRSSNVVC